MQFTALVDFVQNRKDDEEEEGRGGEGGVNSALAEEAKSFISGATFSLQ